jgi:4-hydroxythreonine-4-phosphate dehydrogenase
MRPILKSKNNLWVDPDLPVAITMGDPGGIGPEVIAKALRRSSIRRRGNFIVIGDWDVFAKHMKVLPSNVSFTHCENDSRKYYRVGRVDRINGEGALKFLQKGIELLKQKRVKAMVTGPLAKESVKFSLPMFQGHTEYLADSFGVHPVGMLFVSDLMKVIIVTRHLPLKDVPRAISQQAVVETITLVHQALKDLFFVPKPLIGVCGLNPHAGENGTMGTEEISVIIPAIKQVLRRRIMARGPFPSDTLFYPQRVSAFDAVVAMYHDQGLIPVKTLGANRLVNLTIGLPFIRTSPAHGTAFDIAGKDLADASSMSAAIDMAIDLSS